MPSGWTTTSSLADSLPSVISSARIVQEHAGVVVQLSDRYRLGKGIGNTWNEVSMAKLTAQAITERTEFDNPQEMSDTLLGVTPAMVGIHTFLTDRVRDRLDKKAFGQLGELCQNAIQRKKDLDGLTMLDGASTSLPGAGSTLTSGVLSAMVNRIQSDPQEPGDPPFYAVLHGHHIHDLYSELTAGVGTYVVGEGETARALRDGFRGNIGGAKVYIDNNISIDSADDAKGGVFAKRALILVEGAAPRVETKREPQRGGGGDSIFHYDDYAYAERSPGNWMYEVNADATAPTS